MSEPYSQAEADRYRRWQYTIPPPTEDPDGLLVRGLQTRDRYIAQLQRNNPRVRPFVPMTEQAQRAYVATQFPNGTPNGIGIQQGETAHIARDEQGDAHRFLATDFLLDCTALVLVARDAQGNVLDTSLSHINVRVDAPRAVRELLDRMPPGSRIDATLLGGPQGDSYYAQMDILSTVANDPRVTRVRHGFDAATTVAVDVATGTILTATPHETEATQNSIRELPVNVTFTPEYDVHRVGFQPWSVGGNLFLRAGYRPVLPLWESYTANGGMQQSDTTWRLFEAAIANDGKITVEELRAIADDMGRYLQTPVQVGIDRDAQNRTQLRFLSMGVEVDRITSSITEPELPAHGLIDTSLRVVGRTP